MIGKNSARYNATREIMMITGKEVIYSRRIMPIQIVIDQWTILCDSKNGGFNVRLFGQHLS